MVKDLSNRNIYKILATESRRADLSLVQLAEVHKKLGQLLSYEVLDHMDTEMIEIQHVQGIKKSIAIAPDEKFILLVLMRGGLYVAEGMKEIFDGKYVMEFSNGLNMEEFIEKFKEEASLWNLIIIDSVINTGKSIDGILSSTKMSRFKRTFIATLVIQEMAVEKYSEMDLLLFAVRVSSNFYIGKGNTDTGNRLFGQISE